MAHETEHLVARATRGDAGAKEELLVRLLPALRAFIRLRTGPGVRARESSFDLVQSVCREVLTDLKALEYRGEAAFRQWLFTAALRKLADRGRAAARLERVGSLSRPQPAAESSAEADASLADCYAATLSPSHDAMLREDAAVVEGAFDRLPDDYREVILLSRIVGLSHREAAERMGRTEDGVRKLLARALARFTMLLKGERGARP